MEELKNITEGSQEDTLLEEYFNQLNEEAKIKESFLENIKSEVSQKEYEGICQSLKDSEYTFDYRITSEPYGDYQKESYVGIEGQWVNQTCNGGFTGDEFAGTVSIKINNNKYFTYNYQM